MLNPDTCPNYQKEVQNNFDKAYAEINEMDVTYKPFLNKTSSIFNLDPLNMMNITPIYDVLCVDRSLGRQLPSSFS